MFNFEKLEVWQKAIQCAELVHQSTKALSQACLSKQIGFLSEADFNTTTLAAEEQSRMLSGRRLYLTKQ